MPVYFFTDWYLVCLFHSKNVSFSNSICRNLMFLHVFFFFFRVGLLISRVCTLSTFFHVQCNSFCSTTGRKLMILRLLLRLSTFSRTIRLSTCFRSKMDLFCNSICRYLMGFFMSTLFMPVYLFTGFTLSSFFTERVLRSVTPYEETLIFVMFTFVKNWHHVYHFYGQSISFYHTKGGKLRVLQVFFSRLSTFFTSQKVSFCKICEISRPA